MLEDWASFLSRRLGRSPEQIICNGLSAADFACAKTVRIEIEDQSVCSFNYAFCLIDRGTQMLAVFSEHCGYHVFSVRAAAVWENDDLFLDGR